MIQVVGITILSLFYTCQEVEEDESTGFICYEKFNPMMTRVLLEGRYKPGTEEQLLKAFKVKVIFLCIWSIINQVLDRDKKSHLTPEELKEFLTSEGEPFQQVTSLAIDVYREQGFPTL